MKEKVKEAPKQIFIDESLADKRFLQPVSFRAKEKPADIKQKKESDGVDCLVVSCAELVGMFEKDYGLKVEESFLEEAAI